jgi:enoyl-CoA hydratase/3-hydroxyacyl-CoA dehydrogenase
MSSSSPRNPLLTAPERPLPRRVGIVGAGTIGPDIGYYLAGAVPGLQLLLVDVAQEALDRATATLHGYLEKAVARRKLDEAGAADVRSRLSTTLDYEELAGCDWVLESATENLALKREIFARIESIVDGDALITSNTSSLPAARLFGALERPGRATVTHFFAPAFRNPAVEVVSWERGDPQVVEYLRWLFCTTGKVPLVTADELCFMLDRVFDNWCNEAALLLDTATAAQVDSVASEFVHAGPFFVLNLAHGNPIIVETNTLQADEEGEHYRPASIFRSVERWVTVGPGKRVDVPAEVAAQVRDRLAGVLLSQAVDILDRDIGSPADLDLGCSLALGFKQGPLALMQRLGAAESTRILDRFGSERPGMPAPSRPLESYQQFLRHVLVDEVDGVVVLTLRRPQAMNALDDEVTDELLSVISGREGDPDVRGFVITGYGPSAFCAGADVGRFPEMLGKADEAAQFARDCSRLLVHLDRCTKPVVAALNGMALGGGLELAIRCHGLVAHRDAWLQFPEITLGIAPGIGAMVVPFRRWPQAAPVFHDMLRRADKLTAKRAHELGVIAELADDPADLIRRAVATVHSLQGHIEPTPDGPVALAAPTGIEPTTSRGQVLSREVIGIIEEAVAEGAAAPTLAEALEIGYRAFGRSADTAAAREGIAAFRERRAPDFETTG